MEAHTLTTETTTLLDNEVLITLEKLQLVEVANNRTPSTRDNRLQRDCENRLSSSNFKSFLDKHKSIASTPQSSSSYLAEMRQRRKRNLNRTTPYPANNPVKARKSLTF